MEPYLSVALTQRNKTLKDFFEVKILEMPVKGCENDSIPQTTERVGVFCSDLRDLVSHLIAKRGMDPTNSDIHIGIDGGQGSLKVGVTITERDDEVQNTRSKYYQGVAPKQNKNSSVKKLLLVALVQDITVNYSPV